MTSRALMLAELRVLALSVFFIPLRLIPRVLAALAIGGWRLLTRRWST